MVAISNSDFLLLDTDGESLESINVDEIKTYKAVVLRNLSEVSTSSLDSFSKKFGKPLMYGDSSEMVFEGLTTNEDDLHYDGISSEKLEMVPQWLVFHLEKALNPQYKGQFLIVDSVNSLANLSKEVALFLRKHKQQFFGYPCWNNPNLQLDDFAFEIDCITEYKGVERLRIHVPLYEDSTEIVTNGMHVYTKPHDFSLGFSGCDAIETMDVLNKIREVLFQDDNMWTIQFQDNDVLIANNEQVFHGRHSLVESDFRIMRRRQMLIR